MARNGRLENNYGVYPIETFDKVFAYIMMSLPRENRMREYQRPKHQDKLATVKILMEWHNLPTLFPESEILFPYLNSIASVIKYLLLKITRGEKISNG